MRSETALDMAQELLTLNEHPAHVSHVHWTTKHPATAFGDGIGMLVFIATRNVKQTSVRLKHRYIDGLARNASKQRKCQMEL